MSSESGPLSPFLSKKGPLSPNSSPNGSAVPPATSNDSTPPSESNPNQTTDSPPPLPSAPPPQSSPPPDPSASPPSPPQASPPEASPPPPPPSSPPSPPPLPPPSPPPPSSPPSPPPSPPAPPPDTNSPPPPTLPPPPTSQGSPPKESPAAPLASPPPPPAISPSPPPPDPSPPTSSPPPPHRSKHSPPPPPALPPTPISSPPIPPASSPPPASTASPPPVPSPPSPPFTYPPLPSNNTSVNGSLPASPLPSHSTEKPTARSTQSNITSEATSRNSGGLKAGGVAAVVSIVGFLALTLVVLAVWFAHKRKKRRNRFTLNYTRTSPFASSHNSDSSFLRSQFSSQRAGSASANSYMYSPDGGIGASRSWFTYQELSAATNGFSGNNLLGEGGFGCVYKGVLLDGREVAVKQLKDGGGQGEREFRAEVEIISRIHHRHLVTLVGYCISENQRLLVYDYVPNNTLHYHLHDEGKTVMDWASRVKVAAGAARGLAYLHEDCDESLVEWARPLLTQALEKEDFGDLVDPKLGTNFIPNEMFRMIEAAAACVRHLASKRPRMSQVVRALDSMDELADLNNGVKPGQSGIFSSREHSAQIRMFQRMAFGSQDYSSDYLNDSQSSWSRRS
ncbi:Proline-rich receptor-like protein kinase PERK8 [Sesamum alatum]|uniref:non-specific serine/threonine protein kinase n=1 Tax=Sesamum alatum TaxID=300844 RepID=A0AAE1XQP0_9LAMI|nr:Proline-rich receptor-like protein kinase PERK8 [Sesamum alatum]